KKDRGVTLVELMVAVTIILIAIIPLMSMIIQSVQGTQKLSDRTRASQLVQDMIEEIKQKQWDEDLTGDSEVGFDLAAEDPTDAGTGQRLNCDDIDDYLAYTTGTAWTVDADGHIVNHMVENPPVDEAGNPLDPAKFGKFIRETIIRYVDVPIDGTTEVNFAGNGSGSGGANPTTFYKQVDVRVSWNDTGRPPAAGASGVRGDTVWVWETADNFVHSKTIIARPAP
ncbi:MAG: prepilin-type N-terminal cleavage/methylation domain-containing protein, partial [Elusimicrobiota bacterium]|nr:prepilin-type N-terminal cleavage/methylation domain-containing protein [Elusimicrobiota bacterium]